MAAAIWAAVAALGRPQRQRRLGLVVSANGEIQVWRRHEWQWLSDESVVLDIQCEDIDGGPALLILEREVER